jgi:hypothetical protein
MDVQAVGQRQHAPHGRQLDLPALPFVLRQIMHGVDHPSPARLICLQGRKEPLQEALAAAGKGRRAVQRRLQPAAQAPPGRTPASQLRQAGVRGAAPQLQPVQMDQIGLPRGRGQPLFPWLLDQQRSDAGLGQPVAQQLDVGIGLARGRRKQDYAHGWLTDITARQV